MDLHLDYINIVFLLAIVFYHLLTTVIRNLILSFLPHTAFKVIHDVYEEYPDKNALVYLREKYSPRYSILELNEDPDFHKNIASFDVEIKCATYKKHKFIIYFFLEIDSERKKSVYKFDSIIVKWKLIEQEQVKHHQLLVKKD